MPKDAFHVWHIEVMDHDIQDYSTFNSIAMVTEIKLIQWYIMIKCSDNNQSVYNVHRYT